MSDADDNLKYISLKGKCFISIQMSRKVVKGPLILRAQLICSRNGFRLFGDVCLVHKN